MNTAKVTSYQEFWDKKRKAELAKAHKRLLKYHIHGLPNAFLGYYNFALYDTLVTYACGINIRGGNECLYFPYRTGVLIVDQYTAYDLPGSDSEGSFFGESVAEGNYKKLVITPYNMNAIFLKENIPSIDSISKIRPGKEIISPRQQKWLVNKAITSKWEEVIIVKNHPTEKDFLRVRSIQKRLKSQKIKILDIHKMSGGKYKSLSEIASIAYPRDEILCLLNAAV